MKKGNILSITLIFFRSITLKKFIRQKTSIRQMNLSKLLYKI